MAAYYIYMDQGIAANLAHHTLCSGQFSNCAPIVMLNSGTDMAGLYHFAGGPIKSHQQRDLRVLKEIVRPTVVWLLCGSDGDMGATLHLAGVRPIFDDCTVHESFVHFEEDEHERRRAVITRSWSSIMIGRIGGRRRMQKMLPFGRIELRTKRAFDRLPPDVTLIGERDEEALSMWM